MKEAESPALLDTSVIIRYLTGDVPDLAHRAAEIVESPRQLYVSPIALAETAWVLTSFYEIPLSRICDVLAALVMRRNIRTLHLPKPSVVEALQICRSSRRNSFVDALLWAEARNLSADCQVYTFDRRFPSQGIHLSN